MWRSDTTQSVATDGITPGEDPIVKTFRLLTVCGALAIALGTFAEDTAAQQRDRDRDRDEACECQERDGVRSCTCFDGDFPLFAGLGQFTNRARLGISVSTAQSTEDDRLGVVIDEVQEDSPAEAAGLRIGDIIISIEGFLLTEAIESDLEGDLDPDESLPAQRLLALARSFEEGEPVEVRYLRDGTERVADIEPAHLGFAEFDFGGAFDSEEFEALMENALSLREGAERNFFRWAPEAPGSGFRVFMNDDSNHCPGDSGRGLYMELAGAGRGCVAGAEFRELNPRLGEYFGTDTGLLVIDVDDESPLGLMPGDVVLTIDGREVDDLDRLRRILGSYNHGEEITFEVMRKGSETSVRGSVN